MSKQAEVITVIIEQNTIIEDVKVFLNNKDAEEFYISNINEVQVNWGESFNSDAGELSAEQIEYALEEGTWDWQDTNWSIVHSSNTINVCGCPTK